MVFPKKTTETCKNTGASKQKQQKPVKTPDFSKKLVDTCGKILSPEKTKHMVF